MQKKVLFISHAATRSGAPLVLLYLLQWLKHNTNIAFDVLLLDNGPLKNDFEKTGTVYVLDDFAKETLLQKLTRKLKQGGRSTSTSEIMLSKLVRNNYSIVYGNTVLSLPYISAFKWYLPLAKSICCIHEMPFVISIHFTRETLSETIASLDCVIAVSTAVSEALITEYHVPKEKIEIIHSFIPTTENLTPTGNMPVKSGNGKLILGGCGSPEWRKGTDLLPAIAVSLRKKYPMLLFEIHWIGGKEEDYYRKQIEYCADKMGVRAYIKFMRHVAEPSTLIRQLDIFMLLSREEPWGLVALEASICNVPVIAFENAGGIKDLIEDNAGYFVEYENIDALTTQIYDIYTDKAEATKRAEKAKVKVTERYSTPVISNRVAILLKTFL